MKNNDNSLKFDSLSEGQEVTLMFSQFGFVSRITEDESIEEYDCRED